MTTKKDFYRGNIPLETSMSKAVGTKARQLHVVWNHPIGEQTEYRGVMLVPLTTTTLSQERPCEYPSVTEYNTYELFRFDVEMETVFVDKILAFPLEGTNVAVFDIGVELEIGNPVTIMLSDYTQVEYMNSVIEAWFPTISESTEVSQSDLEYVDRADRVLEQMM